jgi:hypothetical protein
VPIALQSAFQWQAPNRELIRLRKMAIFRTLPELRDTALFVFECAYVDTCARVISMLYDVTVRIRMKSPLHASVGNV